MLITFNIILKLTSLPDDAFDEIVFSLGVDAGQVSSHVNTLLSRLVPRPLHTLGRVVVAVVLPRFPARRVVALKHCDVVYNLLTCFFTVPMYFKILHF